MRKFVFLLLAVLSLSLPSKADNARFSLVTCSPGDEAYSLFGHTALRYIDDENGVEKVYNYGYFNFNAPNFMWRFILGETDYMVGAVSFRSFLYEYVQRGSSVTEQVLNLTPAQVARLYTLLEENCAPENRIYRYNYFYNNCTTKARDKIIEALGEGYGIEYASDTLGCLPTLRETLSAMTFSHPWYSFGIGLLMGSDVDQDATIDELQFIPGNLMRDFADATIVAPDGNRMPALKATNLLVKENRPATVRDNFTPFNASLLLLLFTLIVMLCEVRRKKIFWGYDIFLMLMQGVPGCLLLFMGLCSEHPAVDANYAMLLLNPLALVIVPVMVYRTIKHKSPVMAWVQVTFVILFLLSGLFRVQCYPVPLYICALAVLVRSLFHVYKDRICESNII